jgi:dolichol-phosphate mannosyltransferase
MTDTELAPQLSDSVVESRPHISVVVPLFNEEDNVGELVRRILDALSPLGLPFEAILVNDGSRDATASRLQALAANDRRLKVVNFRRNYGQTAAMMAGFRFSRGEIIVSMDGDLQNDPMDIPMMLAKLDEGYSVVAGWRKDRKDATLTRTLPSRFANWLISKTSGIDLHDHGCTLKVFRSDVIEHVRLYGEMHRFITLYARRVGGEVIEVPVRHHPRIHGVSKYGLNRIVKVVLDLMVVKFLEDFETKPIYIFGICGMLSIAASLSSAVWALWLRLFDGLSLIQTPLPLLAVTTFLLGVICILMGLLAEIQVRTYFEAQDKPTYVVRDTINIGVD